MAKALRDWALLLAHPGAALMKDLTQAAFLIEFIMSERAEAAALIRRLVAERDEAREERDIWRSVFPDIAPESVVPDRSLLESRATAAEAEVERLRAERDEAIAQSKRNWDDCGKMHDALGRALQIVCLSEELCDAVDAEAEDIGTGKRNSLRILQEIGPIVKKVQKQAEEAFNGWPRF